MKTIELQNGALRANIALLGAELKQFSHAGRNLIWLPDESLWDSTCPILFPIIGRVSEDVIRVDGTRFPMPMHGFALNNPFILLNQGEESCTLELRASDATHSHYPYDFALTMTYRLSTESLLITAEIHNRGNDRMPASFGLHPGFRWPLVAGANKDDHWLSFVETGPVRYTRPIDRLIGPDRIELPLEGRSMRLTESLFESGGIALLELQSRSLLYHTNGKAAAVRIGFPQMDGIILWSRPGGDFLCIEPLLGHADPVGFAGDVMEKPGMAHIAPGENITLSITITPEFSPA